VVTYDGQARVVEQVDSSGVQLAWRAELTMVADFGLHELHVVNHFIQMVSIVF
jgi:hypothetical protein